MAVNLNIHKTINFGYFACVISVTSDSLQPCELQPTRLLSMGFSRQEYCSGLPWPPLQGIFPHPEIKPTSLTSPAFTGRFFTTRVTCKFHRVVKTLVSFLHTVSEGKKYSRLDYRVVRSLLGSVLNSLQFPETHSPATLLMGSSL